MVANTAEEMLMKVGDSAINILNNTEIGRKATQILMEETEKMYGDKAAEMWEKVKKQVLLDLAVTVITEHEDLMTEFAGHMFNEIRARA